ncbi:hypothetical protein [Micromonospora sp. NPDC049203]|uniref:hypothetical protein n=1 Tax=Micromonospora sp. NPDC049203 TaxID=3364267 RepID=UPI0037123624
MVNEPTTDDSIKAVYIEGDSEAEVFSRAASWFGQRDGAVEIQAVHWRRLHHKLNDTEGLFELHVYFEPQSGFED